MTSDLETFRHYLSISRKSPEVEDRLREQFCELWPMPWLPSTNGELAEADIAVAKAMRAAGRPISGCKYSSRLILLHKEFWVWREALAQYRDAHRAKEQEKWAAEQTRKLRTTYEKHSNQT